MMRIELAKKINYDIASMVTSFDWPMEWNQPEEGYPGT